MRNRTVLAVIGILLIFTESHAQLIRGYGFKVGAVSATETWDSGEYIDVETQYRWGFTASAFLEVLKVPIFSLVAEAQYAQRGAIVSFHTTAQDGLPRNYVFSPRVDYLSVPLMARLRFPMSSLEGYVIVGPRIDFLISTHDDNFVDPSLYKFVHFEIGLSAGLGAETDSVLPVHILAEIRYNSSFRDSFNNKRVRIRSHSLDIMLGVRL